MSIIARNYFVIRINGAKLVGGLISKAKEQGNRRSTVFALKPNIQQLTVQFQTCQVRVVIRKSQNCCVGGFQHFLRFASLAGFMTSKEKKRNVIFILGNIEVLTSLP
jgi:hypothetical protein